MTHEQFLQTVRLMRHWQREFFRTRSQEALERSKDFEAKVDTYIASIYEPALKFD